jgi:hypothetical protein
MKWKMGDWEIYSNAVITIETIDEDVNIIDIFEFHLGM